MKKSEVLELVAALRDRFPKAAKEFSARNAAAYCEDLVDLEFGTAVAAVRRLAATCQWFPSIAEIREAYTDIATPTLDVDEAWAAVKRHGNAIGWGRNKGDHATDIHPAIEAAVEGLGGWRELGCSSDQMADRAHFIKLYTVARKRHRDKIISQPLIEDTQRKLLRGHDEKEETQTKNKVEGSKNIRRLGGR
tara:strand:- start:3353 stop:3928 length:576 start_codon:yes stop_codon:yes gene_type:complete